MYRLRGFKSLKSWKNEKTIGIGEEEFLKDSEVKKIDLRQTISVF